jgi:hypothetical protein
MLRQLNEVYTGDANRAEKIPLQPVKAKSAQWCGNTGEGDPPGRVYWIDFGSP